MALNKSKGNMYPWVTHTWNVIKGKCPHDCNYCYMKRYPQSDLHFDEKELKTDLGSGNTIFVGSSCDMWASDISNEWLIKVIMHCDNTRGNHFLFQTKFPARLIDWRYEFPEKTILGTTIETNRYYADISKAPSPWRRYRAMIDIHGSKIVSIEPIMDFDPDVMVKWMQEIKPEFVSVGADSGNNHLPEPSADKVEELIKGLEEFTEVKRKDNLKRLLR